MRPRSQRRRVWITGAFGAKATRGPTPESGFKRRRCCEAAAVAGIGRVDCRTASHAAEIAQAAGAQSLAARCVPGLR